MEFPQIITENVTLENNKRLLDLEVKTEPGTTETVVKDYNKRKLITAKGFRAGKIPKRIMEQVVGKQTLYVDRMAAEYNKALSSRGFETVEDPELVSFDETEDGSLTFKIKVEILPEFSVRDEDYTGIEVEKEMISEETAAASYREYLQNLAKQNGAYKPVERPAQSGDLVILNLSATLEGQDVPEIKLESTQIPLEQGTLAQELLDFIAGSKEDEERAGPVTLGDKYPVENLRGKTIDVKLRVEAVKELVPHEINDDLAKLTQHAENLNDLQTTYVKNYIDGKTEIANRIFEMACVDKVLKNIGLDIPQTMVTNEVKGLLKYRYDMFGKFGLPQNQAFQNLDYTLLNQQAKNRVASALIFNKLFKNGIYKLEDVSGEDIFTLLQQKAEAEGLDFDKVKERWNTDAAKKTLKKEILYDKFVKHVIAHAKAVPKSDQPTTTHDPASNP